MTKLIIASWVPGELKDAFRFDPMTAPIGATNPDLLKLSPQRVDNLLSDPRMEKAWRTAINAGVDPCHFFDLVSDFSKTWEENYHLKLQSKTQVRDWEQTVQRQARSLANQIRGTPYNRLLEKMGWEIVDRYDRLGVQPRVDNLSELLYFMAQFNIEDLEIQSMYESLLGRKSKKPGSNFERELMIILNEYFLRVTGKPLNAVVANVVNVLRRLGPDEEFTTEEIREKLKKYKKSLNRKKRGT